MAILRSRDKKRKDAEAPTPKLDTQGEMLAVLREIRDKMPSKEETLTAAILSGVIAKQGPYGGDGKLAVGLFDVAKTFAEAAAGK